MADVLHQGPEPRGPLPAVSRWLAGGAAVLVAVGFVLVNHSRAARRARPHLTRTPVAAPVRARQWQLTGSPTLRADLSGEALFSQCRSDHRCVLQAASSGGGGHRWTPAGAPLHAVPNGDILHLVPDSLDGSAMDLCDLDGRPVYRSTDSGRHWKWMADRSSEAVRPVATAALAEPHRRLVLAAGAGHLRVVDLAGGGLADLADPPPMTPTSVFAGVPAGDRGSDRDDDAPVWVGGVGPAGDARVAHLDPGRGWRVVGLPGGGGFTGIRVTDAWSSLVTVVGDTAGGGWAVWTSTDAGTTWTYAPVVGARPFAVRELRISYGPLLALAGDGTVWESGDGGVTFARAPGPPAVSAMTGTGRAGDDLYGWYAPGGRLATVVKFDPVAHPATVVDVR
ncbi:MAG: hypothetical protein ACJ73S_31800 [Mycobacteriales bacterium]